ncbi:histidinol-phosphate transaminase [Chroococcidiopsis sp.]|uniref:histidinol-phosphate transaminase n=1 Tax=Chroococcidiopsis sp. TaxID=3088168 RepID=UPI003F2C65F9
MLPFIRSDLAQFTAYKPHPNSPSGKAVESPISLDRLDTNESPFDLPQELKEKLAWMYQHALESNRYPDGGHAQLKTTIAQYVSESAVLADAGFTSANISVGNGSDELIRSLLIATCLQGEGAILVANPTFSMYEILAQTLGIPAIAVGRNPDNFEIDLAAAKLAIANEQNPPIRVVFVVHPNSPTANALTTAELEWLRSLPQEILVVIDEAYFEFSQTTVASELLHRSNWIVLRTFSKAFRLAAHRVGYAIGHPELIMTLEKIRLPYNLPTYSQAAAAIALQYRHTLLSAIPQILSERSKLMQALTACPQFKVYPSMANFIFIQLQQDAIALESDSLNKLHQQLQASGTLVRQISNGLRITIGTPEENARTLERILSIFPNL